MIGTARYGMVTDAPIRQESPWPSVGVADSELGRAAYLLSGGVLGVFGLGGGDPQDIPIVVIGEIAERGPYHADIYWDKKDRSP